MNTWVYKESEPGLYTVGFYTPSGAWKPDSDHTEREQAANRVYYLNGGSIHITISKSIIDSIETIVEYMYKDEEEDFNNHPGEQDIHIFTHIKRVWDYIKEQTK